MSLDVYAERAAGKSFPRMRGDEPITDAATDFVRWFSPHARG